jgi:predicted metal-dependent peptidase
VAHEISHGFLGDLVKMVMYKRDGFVQGPTKKLPYDATMMNVAEDFRINAMLVEGKVGVMPPVGLYDKAISEKGMESSVEIYEKLAKQGKGGQGQGQGQGQGGGMGGHGGFDIHLDPSQKQQDQANSGRREQAIAAAVQAAQAAGKGNLPGAIMRMINEILEPVVPWQDKLKASMQRAAGDPTYDWRYLDKRLMVRPDPMYFARQAHNGCGTIVIVNDTSGSMTNQMIDRIMAENGGIIADLNPVRVVVVWCDSAIHNVNDLDEPEDVNDLKADIEAQGGIKGGGGTDFRPPFDWVKDHLDEVPDMLVYFTDTYGTFPSQEPEYPVIWGVIVEGAEVPWGEKVFIDLNAS